MSPDVPEKALAALQLGQRIEAIKLTRLATGLGLKEAKDLIEARVAGDPGLQALYASRPSGGARAIGWLIGALLGAAAAHYLWPKG